MQNYGKLERKINKKRRKGEKMEKLKAKDLITIGIFTVLLYAISLIVAFIGFTPLSSMFASPLYALLAGPVFMLYIMKVKKPLAITITGIFCALLCFVSFANPIMAIIALVCFVISDFIASRGKYNSLKMNTVSYLVFSLWSIALNGGYWYMQDFMVEMSLSYGMEQAWLDKMVELATPLNFILMTVGTLICAYIGVIFAKVLFKKHFKKAGII